MSVPERAEPERYITRQELAERMGLSTKSLDRLVKAGAPSYTWGLRTRRFLASEVIAWARDREAGPPADS